MHFQWWKKIKNFLLYFFVWIYKNKTIWNPGINTFSQKYILEVLSENIILKKRIIKEICYNLRQISKDEIIMDF